MNPSFRSAFRKGVERLDPPLVDIFVEDGERRGKSKVNPAEAEVILKEIEKIVADPLLSVVGGDSAKPRSIGVISLIGSEQAAFIQKKLMERVGEALMVRHRIICGDSATFQGDERDIIFLSMIADRKRKQAQTATQYEQRFNVALSRARDRLILVRSVTENELNPNDLKARILAHFKAPMPQMAHTAATLVELCQSSFERDVFSRPGRARVPRHPASRLAGLLDRYGRRRRRRSAARHRMRWRPLSRSRKMGG